jgi:LCP family protein required for cell wall assembly
MSKKYDGTYRINAANYFGGPKYAIKTVNQYLDLNIQHYVMVNFYAFQKIAQALGGITMDITKAEMEEINVRAVEQAWSAYHAGVNEDDLAEANVYLETYGPNTHLNGRQTLAYARIRKLDSDASRSGRQMRVLSELLKKLKTKLISTLITTISANRFSPNCL